MNPRVEKVFPNDDYTLTIHFTNGEIKKYDVKPLLNNGVFLKIKDPFVFKQAHVQLGSVGWPGEIDVCPDTLYENGTSLEDI